MGNFIKGLKTVKLSTWIRTALMAVALINMILEICGKNILPISDQQISQIVTYAFTIIMFVINWWKNNSFTVAAQQADKVLKGEAIAVEIDEEE